jgi:ABC-2 type transport system ATP-binding protein
MSGAAHLTFERASRRFGAVVAVSDVTLELGAGLIGLLGPNGAGKTTLLGMAAGLVRPSSGVVKLFGTTHEADETLGMRLGYVPDADALPPHESPISFCSFLLECQGYTPERARSLADDTLGRLGMGSLLERKLGTLSRGQRQRVKIAQAIAHRPDLLLLDEPLNGLDPLTRIDVASLLREEVARGACVIVSSHILQEVEALTKDVVLLFHGRLVACGPLPDIRALLDKVPHQIRVRCDRPRELARELLAFDAVGSTRIDEDGTVLVETTRPESAYRAVPRAAQIAGTLVTELRAPGEDLQSIFNILVGQLR